MDIKNLFNVKDKGTSRRLLLCCNMAHVDGLLLVVLVTGGSRGIGEMIATVRLVIINRNAQ